MRHQPEHLLLSFSGYSLPAFGNDGGKGQRSDCVPLDCIKPVLQYGEAHKQAILHVYRAVPLETFLFYINRLTQYAVNAYFASISKTISIPARDAEILNHHYKCIVVGYLLDWLDAEMQYDLETDIERICSLMEGVETRALQKSIGQTAVKSAIKE